MIEWCYTIIFPGRLTDGGCLFFWFANTNHRRCLNIAAVTTKCKNTWLKEFPNWAPKNLIGELPARKRPSGEQPNAAIKSYRVQHFVIKSEMRGYCKNDFRSKTTYKCSKCDIFCVLTDFSYTTHKSQTDIRTCRWKIKVFLVCRDVRSI